MFRLVLGPKVLRRLQILCALSLLVGCISPKKSEQERSTSKADASSQTKDDTTETRTYFIEIQGKDRKLVERIKPHLFSKIGSRDCYRSQDVAPDMPAQPDCHAFREFTPKTNIRGLPSSDGANLLYRVTISETQPGVFQYEIQGFQSAPTGKVMAKPRLYFTPGTFAAPSENQKARGKIRLSTEEAAEQIGFTIVALSFRRDE